MRQKHCDVDRPAQRVIRLYGQYAATHALSQVQKLEAMHCYAAANAWRAMKTSAPVIVETKLKAVAARAIALPEPYARSTPLSVHVSDALLEPTLVEARDRRSTYHAGRIPVISLLLLFVLIFHRMLV